MNNPDAQAREWFMRVQSGELSDQQQEALADWLCADPEHLEAYQRCEALWEDLGSLALTPEGEALRRSSATTGLRDRLRSFAAELMGGGRAGLVAPGLSVAAVTALVLGALLWLNQGGRPDEGIRYQTGIAEITTHELEDGSQITLGAQSNVRVRFGDTLRRVEVRAGRVFFDVANAPERPFHVYAHDARVEVVGTQFDVHRTDRRVNVSVREGVVSVSASDRTLAPKDAVPSVMLTAGDQVTKTRNEAFTDIERVAQEDISAWMQGRLVYRNTPLVDVIDEVNRYSRDRITLASPALQDMELTASFDVDQLDSLPELLAKSLPVRVQRESEGHYIVFSR